MTARHPADPPEPAEQPMPAAEPDRAARLDPDAETPVSPHPPRRPGADVALVAAFAALIAVCALLPGIRVVGPVPITLQTLAVVLSGAVLGARRGALAALLYLAVGAAGIPVFSGGTAGLGVFAGPTVGYLVSFPLVAGLCGLVVQRLPRRLLGRNVALLFGAGLVSSALVTHPLGIAGLVWRADLSWTAALATDAVFWPGDVVKNLVMAVVATAVHRAFPDLLPHR